MKFFKLLFPLAAVWILLAADDSKPARLCTGKVAPLAYCPNNFTGTVNVIPSGSIGGADPSSLNLEDYIAAMCSQVDIKCDKTEVSLTVACSDRERTMSAILNATERDDVNVNFWQWRRLGLVKNPDTKGITLRYCGNNSATVVDRKKMLTPMMISSDLITYGKTFVLKKKLMIKSSQQGLAANGSILLASMVVGAAVWLKGYSA